jgi:predicted RNA-binding protein with PUA-like domain
MCGTGCAARRAGCADAAQSAKMLQMSVLLKTEPSEYSFAELERDGETVWDGVTNPQALKFLRELKPGAKIIIYHTGEERSAVGTARVLSVDAADPKSPVVRIEAGKRLAQPVPLAAIKANKLFAQSPLLKQGRLSVVPLSDEQFRFLLSGGK